MTYSIYLLYTNEILSRLVLVTHSMVTYYIHNMFYDKSGNLNPVYSPDVDGNVLLILDTAQEGNTTRMSFPNHCQHHLVSYRYPTYLYFLQIIRL